jgi:hypothetical protein
MAKSLENAYVGGLVDAKPSSAVKTGCSITYRIKNKALHYLY